MLISGKFTNVTYPELGDRYTPGSGMTEGSSVQIPSISFEIECPSTTGDHDFDN